MSGDQIYDIRALEPHGCPTPGACSALAQISALATELAEAKEQFDHFQKLASEHRDEIQVSLAAAQARIAELECQLANVNFKQYYEPY